MARQEILKIYDKALFNWMKKKIVVSGHTLGYHVATPDRPFGFDIPTNPDDGTIDTKRAINMLMTPQVSLIRTTMDIDMSRNNTNIIRGVNWWDEEKKMSIRSKYPRPWNLNYQIDIVARLRNDIQNAIQWFLYYTDPVRLIKVDFQYPWGNRFITLKFSRIEDNSDIEAGEGLRYYRYTIPCVVEAFMFEAFERPSDIPHGGTNPDDFTTRNRVVHTNKIRLIETSSNATLATYTIETPPPDYKPNGTWS